MAMEFGPIAGISIFRSLGKTATSTATASHRFKCKSNQPGVKTRREIAARKRENQKNHEYIYIYIYIMLLLNSALQGAAALKKLKNAFNQKLPLWRKQKLLTSKGFLFVRHIPGEYLS